MPQKAGSTLGAGDYGVTFEGDGSASAGDAIAIDQDGGQAMQGDSGNVNADQFAGVASDDFGEDGDSETVKTAAPTGIVANVAAGVSAGERLDLSATAGELTAADGGPVVAFSDEGGTSPTGVSLPDGTAWVVY